MTIQEINAHRKKQVFNRKVRRAKQFVIKNSKVLGAAACLSVAFGVVTGCAVTVAVVLILNYTK